MEFFQALVSLIFIDIILGGDNAVVIALACRDLPKANRMKAILLGTSFAIILRIIFAVIATKLLELPYLKLIGGLFLIEIAVKLAQEKKSDKECASGTNIWNAVKIIFMADVVMSLDNVIAIAGIAHGNWFLLILGLLMSVPCIVWGSQMLLNLIEKYSFIIYIAIAILGWTAGKLIVHDALIKSRIGAYSLEIELGITGLTLLLAQIWKRITR